MGQFPLFWRKAAALRLEHDPENHDLNRSAPESFEQQLRDAAWEGFISKGLLQRGYHSRLTEVQQQRAANAVRQGDLTDQLRDIDAELESLVVQPLPPPREPKVLRTLSTILPFKKGVERHG